MSLLGLLSLISSSLTLPPTDRPLAAAAAAAAAAVMTVMMMIAGRQGGGDGEGTDCTTCLSVCATLMLPSVQVFQPTAQLHVQTQLTEVTLNVSAQCLEASQIYSRAHSYSNVASVSTFSTFIN